MDNTDNSVPKQFKEQFNTGYLYSKYYTEIGKNILEMNLAKLDSDILNSALILGIREYILERQKGFNSLEELKRLRNGLDFNNEHEIEY